jgi:hypothetical protein
MVVNGHSLLVQQYQRVPMYKVQFPKDMKGMALQSSQSQHNCQILWVHILKEICL